MSPSAVTSEPIYDVRALSQHFALGAKPGAEHLIGLEHEKVGVLAGGRAPSYEGEPDGRGSIRALLEAVGAGGDWQPVSEGSTLIGLKRSTPTGAASVSLEPGGQFELSDAPRGSARGGMEAVRAHLEELEGPARDQGIRFLGVGFRPFGTLEDIPWMPKGRYRVMRAYLPTRGTRGHEMMKRTATVQANIDYHDQADCAAKMRAAMGTSSLVTALFAASSLVDGKVSGFQSYRAHAWLDTDESRCGLLPFVFADSAEHTLYEDYAAWALDVPMFFVYRDGTYHAADGLSFRRFLAEGFRGERASLADWELHLSTLFPEVRLKQYLEMRAADAGPLSMVYALPALYRGLLYDNEACRAAFALVADWSFEERVGLRQAVPREGLLATVRGASIRGRAAELVAIAREGLVRLRADEDLPLLAPLEAIAAGGPTVADQMVAAHERTNGDPARLIELLAL